MLGFTGAIEVFLATLFFVGTCSSQKLPRARPSSTGNLGKAGVGVMHDGPASAPFRKRTATENAELLMQGTGDDRGRLESDASILMPDPELPLAGSGNGKKVWDARAALATASMVAIHPKRKGSQP